jgi:8-oxo-dGTP pyrophosphatase MutT (NUDIX family)
MVIKEPTASTFVFRREAGTWLTALVWHPRLDCWLPSGGHVENTENTEEAAIREAREETGLDVQLLPGPAAPVPAGYPHKVLCAPWWITEMGPRRTATRLHRTSTWTTSSRQSPAAPSLPVPRRTLCGGSAATR